MIRMTLWSYTTLTDSATADLTGAISADANPPVTAMSRV
jgi:hypothetical protein